MIAALIFNVHTYPLRRGLKSTVGSESVQLEILLLLSLFLLWFLPFADRRGIFTISGKYWRYLGLLLCCVGAGIRLLALKAIGDCFSAYVTLQPHHRLVRDGLYKTIRHPLYLSLLLLPAGVALVFASVLALPIFLLAALFVTDRIRKEENLLAQHFGADFLDYRRATWKLIPYMF